MDSIFLNQLHTPIGEITAGVSDDGIHILQYSDSDRTEKYISYLSKHEDVSFKDCMHRYHTLLFEELEEYFNGNRKNFSIPFHPKGTDFQRSIWRRLQQISFGVTVSYKTLSNSINKPKAIRAVAAAIGRNPVVIIIPCHRVVGNNGQLTGYSGGIIRKQFLLNHERRISGIKAYKKDEQLELF